MKRGPFGTPNLSSSVELNEANISALNASISALDADYNVAGGTEARTFTEVCRPILGNLADLGPDYILFRIGEHRRSYYRERVPGDPLYTGALGNDLGELVNEAAARAISGATTNDFYHNTTDGKFYKLNVTTGQTEILRGPKAEFPQSYEIRAEATRVIIFDEQTGSMWRTIKAGRSHSYFLGFSTGGAISSVVFIGGCLFVGLSGTTTNGSINALAVMDFAADTLSKYDEIGFATSPQNLIEHDDGTWDGGLGWYNIAKDTTRKLVNQYVNAVAATILPDAPANPDRNGMREITWAVGTDGGVSVCKNGGAVVDITGQAQAVLFVDFSKQGELISTGNYQDQYYAYAIPPSDILQNDATYRKRFYTINSTPARLSGTALALSDRYNLSSAGLTTFWENPEDPSKGMVAYQAEDYVTPVMYGDVKGAWFCEWGQAGTLVGANLESEDFTGFVDTAAMLAAGFIDGSSAGGAIALDAAGDFLSLDYTSGVARFSKAYTTTIDEWYIVQVKKGGALCSVNIGDAVGAGASNGSLYSGGHNATDETITFKAVSNPTYIGAYRSSAGSGEVHSIALDKVTPDRSVNNKGAILNGSLTQDAEGWVSGFSAANYAEQPYNADLDFGTGAFQRSLRLKMNATTTAGTVFARDSATTAQRDTLDVTSSGVLSYAVDDGTTVRTATGTMPIDDGIERDVIVGYDGVGGVFIKVDGEVYATATGAALLTMSNTAAVMRIGLNAQGANPLTNGSIRWIAPEAGNSSTNQNKVKAAWDGMGLAGTFKDQFFDETSGDLLVLTSTHLHRVDPNGRVTSEAATADFVSQYFNREALA